MNSIGCIVVLLTLLVIEYLGRYTHKVAISNHRILGIENDLVRFRYKDYREPLKIKRPRREKKLPVVFSKEEITAFFEGINNVKHKAIFVTVLQLITGRDLIRCSKCKKGTMIPIQLSAQVPEDS